MKIYLDNWMFHTEDVRRWVCKEDDETQQVVLTIVFKNRTDATNMADAATFVRPMSDRSEIDDLVSKLKFLTGIVASGYIHGNAQ